MSRKIWIGWIVLAGGLSGCRLAGGPPVPEPAREARSPGPAVVAASAHEPEAEDGGAELAMRVVATAFEAIGTPYAWGGSSANGFDCSGLIRYAYGLHGIDLPRISRDQMREGAPVEGSPRALLPGDILGFSDVPGGEVRHVGLYVGNGEFIHSSTAGVRISDLGEPYWQRHLTAARRLVR